MSNPARPTRRPEAMVISYLGLRKSIGMIGIALPFLVLPGGVPGTPWVLQDSISAFYHTDSRNVFVGSLCAIAVFLFSYCGYDDHDRRTGRFAALFGLGTAFFPTAPRRDVLTAMESLHGNLHVASAALFFGTLAYFSIFLFRKTEPGELPTPRKLMRNRVYMVCGTLMVIALLGIVATRVFDLPAAVMAWRPVFVLEAVAIVAFGISWLTKGEAILKDEVPQPAGETPRGLAPAV